MFSIIDLRKGLAGATDGGWHPEDSCGYTLCPVGESQYALWAQKFRPDIPADDVLADIPHIFRYLDDLLVASLTAAANRGVLQRAMERLKKQGLIINKEKCQFLKVTGGVPVPCVGSEWRVAAAGQDGGREGGTATVAAAQPPDGAVDEWEFPHFVWYLHQLT